MPETKTNRVPTELGELVGATVTAVETVPLDSYVVIQLSTGATLYADDPTLYTTKPTSEEPRMNLYPYYVNYVQAAEPNELPDADGIAVEIDTPSDEMGLPRVIVRGRSHEQIVDYVGTNWGAHGDPEWFKSYIVDRIESVKSPHEWVVTTTPDDPSLSALWLGNAVDALHALDQFADQEEMARYSDTLAMDDESFGNLIGLHAPRGLWAIYTNTTVWAIPLQTNTASNQTPQTFDCECGSGPFDSEESVQRHRDQWHKTPVLDGLTAREETLPRTILVHLNVDVPEDAVDDEADIADDVRRELESALEVGGKSEHTPILQASNVVIADAEEV